MSNIGSTIRALKGLRSLSPASSEAIAEAEKQLGLKFSDEFKQYLLEFGVIYSEAVQLKGIAKTKGYNVAAFTLMAREVWPEIPRNFYVISETGYNGIIICQNENGFVYECRPNNEIIQIASSLSEYIESEEKKIFGS